MPASTASRRKAWFCAVEVSLFVPNPTRATSVPATFTFLSAVIGRLDTGSAGRRLRQGRQHAPSINLYGTVRIRAGDVHQRHRRRTELLALADPVRVDLWIGGDDQRFPQLVVGDLPIAVL